MVLRDKNNLTEAEFLANYQAQDYPRPSVTADILLFAPDSQGLSLLLVERGGHPYLGSWALPGGFANPGESVDQAAARELAEETHLSNLPLWPLGLFSDVGRDPRGWVISQAYIAVTTQEAVKPQAGDDAAAVRWFNESSQRQGNTLDLALKAGNTRLTAKLLVTEQAAPWGVQRNITLKNSDGLAFDHGKIICSGLLYLGEKNK